MTTTVHELVEQAKAHLRDASGIRDRYSAEGRDPTAGEKASIDRHLAEASRLKDEATHQKDREGLLKLLDDFGEAVGVPGGGAGDLAWERRDGSLAAEWSTKAVDAIHSSKGLVPTGTIAMPSPMLDPVRDAQNPTFVADLIPSGRTTGSMVAYWKQTDRSLNAAPYSPADTITGVSKPESDLAIDREEIPVETIAHLVSDVQRNDLADASWLRDFIAAEMLYGLRLAVDEQILDGTGTPPEQQGIIGEGAVQTQTFSTDLLTTIRKAVTKLQMEFFVPTGMVLHPADAERLDLVKDAESRYYFAGPQRSGASPVWSAPTVVTPAMTEGSAILGDFAGGARIFSREEAMLDVDTSAGFTRNLVTFRAELRMAFAITRPKAFCVIDLTA